MNGFLVLLAGAILGAAVTYVLPIIIGAPRYLWQIHKGETRAEGMWYSYHFTKKSYVPVLRQSRLKIKRNFRGQLTVLCWEAYQELHYRRRSYDSKGTALREWGYLVLRVSSRRYYGHWSIRLIDPIEFHEKCVPGLWLGFDLDGQLIAGPIIFSRQELSIEEAKSFLTSEISNSSAFKLLGIGQKRKGTVKGKAMDSAADSLSEIQPNPPTSSPD